MAIRLLVNRVSDSRARALGIQKREPMILRASENSNNKGVTHLGQLRGPL
jgi:hypothetical protein